jgi:glutamate/tyrosine decarboxylase-like PLP-dependent enzyme
MTRPRGLSNPVAALFPTPGRRRELDRILADVLEESGARVRAGAVTPTIDLGAFRHDLARFDFATMQPLEVLLRWTISQLELGVVHLTHPRYFGLFNPAPTFPAECADRIAAAFNPQLATATTSPVAVEIEAHTIRAVARRAGLPADATGHFTTGGAEANYTALLCALTRSNERFACDGARAFAGAPRFYVSRESHLAWLKIAHQAGIGRDAVRLVATDGSGRIDPGALAAAIATDRDQGSVPVMIGATAGTTNAGMIDPLTACADIAARFGLWYHVDAAWGGAVVASERLCALLAGIERADSVTIDAHKWFATTMGCGMFITPHAGVVSSAFHVSTGYMPSNTRGRDPYVTSMQWSRRFLGLRLFLSLAAAGWGGYARHVERSVALIRRLAGALATRGWTICNEPALGVLCVRPPMADDDTVRAIVGRILTSGRAWISAATFEGRAVIRACVTHGEASADDIAELVEALEAARAGEDGRSMRTSADEGRH